jgi:hypothetical protein
LIFDCEFIWPPVRQDSPTANQSRPIPVPANLPPALESPWGKEKNGFPLSGARAALRHRPIPSRPTCPGGPLHSGRCAGRPYRRLLFDVNPRSAGSIQGLARVGMYERGSGRFFFSPPKRPTDTPGMNLQAEASAHLAGKFFQAHIGLLLDL